MRASTERRLHIGPNVMHAAGRILVALGLLLAAMPLASQARADGPVEGRPRVGKLGLRVLQVFMDTRQALVFDKDAGKHVVLGEGERLGKYEIVEVDEDAVVVRVGGRELVLPVDETAPGARPPAPPVERDDRDDGDERDGGYAGDGGYADEGEGDDDELAGAGERTVLDPYAPTKVRRPAVTIESGPLDPYSPLLAPTTRDASAFGMIDMRTPVREVLAPDPQRATGTFDPYGTTTTTTAPTTVVSMPTTESPAPIVTPTPVTTEPTRPVTITGTTTIITAPAGDATPAVEKIRVDALTVSRAELSAALDDFDKLAKEIGFARVGTGIRLSRVPAGSYFHRLGFRAGDLVTAIDGAPMRSLDDAAGVYVRLGAAKKLAVDLERAGARGTLRFALK